MSQVTTQPCIDLCGVATHLASTVTSALSTAFPGAVSRATASPRRESASAEVITTCVCGSEISFSVYLERRGAERGAERPPCELLESLQVVGLAGGRAEVLVEFGN